MTRRIRLTLQAVLTLASVIIAVGIIRTEVVDETSALARPVDVAADAEVQFQVSGSDAPEVLSGTFRIIDVSDHAELLPTTEYEDPIRREGGRPVVVGIGCDCPISDDLLGPKLALMDDDDRIWTDDGLSQPSPDDYAELTGYMPRYRLGEENPYRYAQVIIVPAEVAGEVRPVLQQTGGPAYRFAR